MTRRLDWQPRFEAVLAAWARRPASWQATCVDFAVDVVAAVTGRDVGPSMPMRSARAVATTMRGVDAKTLTAAASAWLGAPVGCRQVRRGDIVEATADMALGACLGDRVAFVGDGGLVIAPLHAAARGWQL